MDQDQSNGGSDLLIQRRDGIVQFPIHHMRGGTSTGLILWEQLLPTDRTLREELLRHLMGVPLSGHRPDNRQLTGLGRGVATSNKVFLADVETAGGTARLVSTLAQLAGDHDAIDWSVNCGNMSSALPLWALDTGFMRGAPSGAIDISVRNTNTGVLTLCRMRRNSDGHFATAHIPGVDGQFPGVDLFLQDPVGSKTGRLLPTGAALDMVAGHAVSCVDVAVPMIIADAASFGKTAQEPMAALLADKAFMAAFRKVWIEAGLRMGLKGRDGQPMTRHGLEQSETIPKACIVGPPAAGGTIAVRYFTPQTGHATMAVSGGCCLAAATLIPGTVAFRLARGAVAPQSAFADIPISIENPAGLLDATVVAKVGQGDLLIESVAYRRNAQILVRGHVPLYRASSSLVDALRGLSS